MCDYIYIFISKLLPQFDSLHRPSSQVRPGQTARKQRQRTADLANISSATQPARRARL